MITNSFMTNWCWSHHASVKSLVNKGGKEGDLKSQMANTEPLYREQIRTGGASLRNLAGQPNKTAMVIRTCSDKGGENKWLFEQGAAGLEGYYPLGRHSPLTFDKHPEESGEVKIADEDDGRAEGRDAAFPSVVIFAWGGVSTVIAAVIGLQEISYSKNLFRLRELASV